MPDDVQATEGARNESQRDSLQRVDMPLLRWLEKTNAAMDAFVIWMTWPISLFLGWAAVEMMMLGEWVALRFPAGAAALWYLGWWMARRRRQQRHIGPLSNEGKAS